jgi:pilus assembly protein Flp/PilA
MKFETIKAAVAKFVKDEDGLTTVEYAVAGGLIVAALVTAFTNLGAAVGAEIQAIIAILAA